MGNAIKHSRVAAAAAFGLAAVFTLLSFTPFGCRKWNNPPEAPSSPSPDSGARNVGIRPVLSWVSDDPDGDTVRFDVYLGTDSFNIRDSVPGAPLMEAGWAHDTLTSSALQLNRRYYWQVLARDSHGDSAVGPLWTFTTTATNRPPNRPNSPSPDSGAIGVSRLATLSWKGGDPDSGDVARYDVYFGIVPGALQMVDSLLVDASYATETLAYDSTYYWKVVSRDNSGARDTGSVWRFRTASELRITDPDSGDQLQVGRPDTIWWTGGPTVGLTLLGVPGGVQKLAGTRRSAGGAGYQLSGGGRRPALSLDAGDSTVVYRSSDDGATWLRVGRATIPNRMPWVVPAPATAQARVRVKVFLPGDTVAAVSGRFVTYDSILPTPITVTQPTASSRWIVGSVQTVTWTGGTDAIDSTTVYYSTDGGTAWARQGKATSAGEFQWTVPDAPSTLAKIEVRAYLGGSLVTGQSPVFEVAALPSAITVTQPTASSRWMINSVHDVTWTGGTDAVDSTAVYYSGNNGVTWQRQGKAVLPGEFQWTVPGTPSMAAKIEVRAYLDAQVVTGQSPVFQVTEPQYPDSVIATVTVGSRPRALCWDSTDNRVFVSCYSDSSLAVIDGAGNTVLAKVGVGGFSSSVLWNPTDNKVYAASETRNTVTIIDGASMAVLDTLLAGVKPVAMCWNRTSDRIYVANNRDSSVTIIDGATNEVVMNVAVGGSPVALAWNPANNSVYVANFGTTTVSVIDGTSNEVTPVALGYYYPCAVIVDTLNNEVYVAHRNDGRLSVIDGGSNSVVATIAVGQQPWALDWNGAASRLYCANSQSGDISIINCATHGVLDDLPVGAQPRSLAWFGPAAKLYAASYGADEVSIVDGTTNQVIGTVTTGASPVALCSNRNESRVYVANYDSGTVTVIGTRLK